MKFMEFGERGFQVFRFSEFQVFGAPSGSWVKLKENPRRMSGAELVSPSLLTQKLRQVLFKFTFREVFKLRIKDLYRDHFVSAVEVI